MSRWKAIKRLSYSPLYLFVVAVGFTLKDRFSEKKSALLGSMLTTMKGHWILAASAILTFVLVCAGFWFFADRREAHEQVASSVQRFLPCKRVLPDHLGIASFKDHYVAHAEVKEARQQLSQKGRLLILGRPSGGKTRLGNRFPQGGLGSISEAAHHIAPEPALREWVAKALVNKGITLGRLNRSEEEIRVYDDVVRRFGDAPEPALREQVAKALRLKAVILGESP